ncbi:hypothetical protein GCM10017781_06390 [Deinococcus metalli]|uniref:Uncharacterized protein n=1 Tax=Deinococcus metalli TaxID=1141878 RepID=A0ABQ3JNB5_9DEIO|nr:hypothetical protein GCM10017781_06390 [Deinococcus metalli]
MDRRLWRQLNRLDATVHTVFSADSDLNGEPEHIRVYFHPDHAFEHDLDEFDVIHTSYPIDTRHPSIPVELCGVTETKVAKAPAKIWRFDAGDFTYPTGYTLAICVFTSDTAVDVFPEFALGITQPITVPEFREITERLFSPLKLPGLINLSWVNEDCSSSENGSVIQGKNAEYGVVVRQDYYY